MHNKSSSQSESNPSEHSQNLNPYIHGTTSQILPLLPLTEFQLMDAITMIEQYHLAPLTGEIDGGGWDAVECRCKPCFGVVHHKDHQVYQWDKIMRYTKPHPFRSSDPVELLEQKLRYGLKTCYCDLNQILIYYVRCRSLGHDVSHLINQELIANMRRCYKILAILLHFNVAIFPKPEQDSESDNLAISSYVICDAILKNFSWKRLLKEVEKLELEGKEITVDYLLDELFVLPEEIESNGLKITLLPNERKLFTGEKTVEIKKSYIEGAGYFKYRLSQNTGFCKFKKLLKAFFLCNISDKWWTEFHSALIRYLAAFESRINLLESALQMNVSQVQCSSESFPMVLVCDDHEAMKKHPQDCEWRAKRPLKIGTDINLVVTDTEDHEFYLQEFFENHGIECRTMLFDDFLRYCNHPDIVASDLALKIKKEEDERIAQIVEEIRLRLKETEILDEQQPNEEKQKCEIIVERSPDNIHEIKELVEIQSTNYTFDWINRALDYACVLF
jgi:hypothetical protein